MLYHRAGEFLNLIGQQVLWKVSQSSELRRLWLFYICYKISCNKNQLVSWMVHNIN